MWIFLAFLVAVLTSVQDVLAKKISSKVSPYVTAWAWPFFSIPVLGCFLFTQKTIVLGPLFWPVLFAGTVSLTVASLFFFKAIEAADLSLSIPMLSFTPLFLLVTSPLMLHEVPSVVGLIGIFLILAGSYVLFYDPSAGHSLTPFAALLRSRGTRYMLIVAVLFSIGGNIDKIGVMQSSPLVWSIALNTAVSVFLGVIMLLKVKEPLKQIKSKWPAFLLIGGTMGLVMVFQMQAIMMTKVPYVIAVKRTSVVMSSLWGVLFFGEKGGQRRLFAILLMVAGVFVIAFGR
jgi:drug/metabolite transporter (DMT)-like permease